MAIHKNAQDHVGPEWVRTDQVGPDRVDFVEQLSVPKLIALHLVPGAMVTVAFVLLAPLVRAAGFPPIAGLLGAILLVLVPVELGIVLRAVRRDGAAAALPYRQRLGLQEWFWLIPVLIVAAFVGFGVHRLVEPWLIAHLFGWLPEWFVVPIHFGGINDYSGWSWIVTLGAFFLLNGVIGPAVEELYFRGFLLPRMERLGRWAPLVNASLSRSNQRQPTRHRSIRATSALNPCRPAVTATTITAAKSGPMARKGSPGTPAAYSGHGHHDSA